MIFIFFFNVYIYSREWLTGLFVRPCASLGFKAPCQGSHLPERHFHQKACSTKSPQSRRSQLCAADELVVWKAFIQEPAICSVSSLLITLKKYFSVEIFSDGFGKLSDIDRNGDGSRARPTFSPH